MDTTTAEKSTAIVHIQMPRLPRELFGESLEIPLDFVMLVGPPMDLTRTRDRNISSDCDLLLSVAAGKDRMWRHGEARRGPKNATAPVVDLGKCTTAVL